MGWKESFNKRYNIIIVSNYGGRQFDGAITSIEALPAIVKVAKGKTAILFDSGYLIGSSFYLWPSRLRKIWWRSRC